ncbi:MAG: preprotein translocase subunit SecY [Patescibacteria group bacterium]
MFSKLVQIFKIKDLRNRILFIFAILIVFRFAAHIPVPGIDVNALKDFFNSQAVLGLLNMMSGGAMENFSIVALGIGPYITSSIIFQLLAMIVPKLEEMSKEGEVGRQKINNYTKILTVPLAFLQGYAMITLLQRSGQGIIGSLSFPQMMTIMTVMTAGTIFLVWLGDLITEKHIGNGISLIIFAGIVSGIPQIVQQNIATYDPSKLVNILIFVILTLVTVAAIVFINESQRNIPVSYARQIRGHKTYGGRDTYLPLRVNQAGMIPIIFAVSLAMMPNLLAQFFVTSRVAWLADAAQTVINIFGNQIFYGLTYFVLVVAFTYFYTSIIFHPQQIAENLQKQGGFVPGIRPGRHTSEYLGGVSNHIMLAGAMFLGVVAVLPLFISGTLSISSVISGASLIIVVSVVIETVRQINSQLTMREYDEI